MLMTLSVVKYPSWAWPFGLLSMAIFRPFLWFQKQTGFWKLMGCGRNGTFDIQPDWHQWAFLGTWHKEEVAEAFLQKSFLAKYWRFFRCEISHTYGVPFHSHGIWDNKEVFGTKFPPHVDHLPVGVLTRATIRFSKAADFWKNVPDVAKTISKAPGFIRSVGIGEVPFLKQATFSIWENMDAVKGFAYRKKEHAEVVKKTRERDWYSEELFARFSILKEVKG